MNTEAEHSHANDPVPPRSAESDHRPPTESDSTQQAALLRRRRTIAAVAIGIVGGGVLGSIAAFTVLDIVRSRRAENDVEQAEKRRRENERIMRSEMEKRRQQQ